MKKLAFLLVLISLGWGATAAAEEKWEGIKPGEEKLFWRNSLFTYEHMFSAYSLNRAAEPMYNPYYVQSWSFRPRFYVRDDLSFRPRLDVEVELTLSDSTDHSREAIISDLWLDTVWTPSFLVIPKVDVKVQPSLRMIFPTSIESRGRSMIMLLGPGVTLRRGFALAKGKWFSSLDVGYSFRVSKYFHRYAVAQHVELEGCSDLSRPECQHRGEQNMNWRFANTLDATLQIMPGLSFGVTLAFFNNLLHEIPAETMTLDPGAPGIVETLPGSRVNHTASTWAIFDVSYDVLEWLSLSVGTSTYYGQLAYDSSYRTPLFNRFTNFYFDITIPIDAFYLQVRKWTGKGSAPRQTAEMKAAHGLLANGY